MALLSTYCGQRGRAPHHLCQSDYCGCECGHPWRDTKAAEAAPLSQIRGDEWENRDAPAGCVNTAARADRTALSERGSAGA